MSRTALTQLAVALQAVALVLVTVVVESEAHAQGHDASGAAEAYAAGQHSEAARRYGVLVETHGPSADLLFNMGTAQAEAGDFGRAIHSLERARLLSPRDNGINGNLDIVRQRVRIARMEDFAGRELTEGEHDDIFAFRLATWFDATELAWLVVLFNLLTFAGLALRRRIRPGALRDTATVVTFVCMTVLAVSLTALLTHAVVVKHVQIGVVFDEGTELHQTPTATAQTREHPDVYAGAALRVLERRSDGWTQVRVVDDTVGWLRSGEIGMVE